MKMKFNLLLSVIFVVTTLTTQAGDTKIKLTFGAEYKLPKKHLDLGFIGNAERGYVQIGHAPGKSLSLQKFDKNLKLVSEKIIDLKGLPKGYVSEGWRE